MVVLSQDHSEEKVRTSVDGRMTQKWTRKETVYLSRDLRKGEKYPCGQDILIPWWEYWNELKLIQEFPGQRFMLVQPSTPQVYTQNLPVLSQVLSTIEIVLSFNFPFRSAMWCIT